MLDSGPSSSPFPSSQLADLVQKAVYEFGRDFFKTLGRLLPDKGTVSKSKAKLAEHFSKVTLNEAYTDHVAP